MKSGKTFKTVLLVVLIEAVLAVVVALMVINSGAYDVAATKLHHGFTVQVLSTTMDHSVARHADAIAVSETYMAPDIAEGFEHYNEMCVVCHGAPGIARGEVGEGLNPPAPDLAKTAGEWQPQEIYWIVKNGIKMSGMPAFGPTHDEEKLWNITAFVKRLPDMTAEEYRKLSEEAEASGNPPEDSD